MPTLNSIVVSKFTGHKIKIISVQEQIITGIDLDEPAKWCQMTNSYRGQFAIVSHGNYIIF